MILIFKFPVQHRPSFTVICMIISHNPVKNLSLFSKGNIIYKSNNYIIFVFNFFLLTFNFFLLIFNNFILFSNSGQSGFEHLFCIFICMSQICIYKQIIIINIASCFTNCRQHFISNPVCKNFGIWFMAFKNKFVNTALSKKIFSCII